MTSETIWTVVATEEDWARFDDRVAGLEDAVVREIGSVGGDYVDHGLNLVYGDRPFLWLLVHCQSPTVPVVELAFVGVTRWSYWLDRDTAPSLQVSPGELLVRLLGVEIVAARMLYRLRDASWLGDTPRVIRLPAPDDASDRPGTTEPGNTT